MLSVFPAWSTLTLFDFVFVKSQNKNSPNFFSREIKVCAMLRGSTYTEGDGDEIPVLFMPPGLPRCGVYKATGERETVW
jgi:hypothetical protein